MTHEIYGWLQVARQVEIHKAGNPQALIDWYNSGADGQIQWGQHGDFDACVAIAGKYISNPEGFCQLRHIDATGEPAGKAPGEVEKADKTDYTRVISNRKGKPSDEDLYQQVVSDAKKKFDVYPSAVANGWVVQEYKRRGGKYRVVKAGDTFTPPQEVRNAAQKALEWLKDGKAGSGFTAVGRKRASDLANGHAVSYDTIKRIKAYFDRHQPDKKSPHWDEPSPGKVAWYAWGGDPAYSWAKGIVRDAEKVEKGDKPGHEFHGNQWKTVSYGAADPQEYASGLREGGLDPEAKISNDTNIGKVMSVLNRHTSAGFGYLGARTRALGNGEMERVSQADQIVKDHAIKEGWTTAQLASFTDSRAGRHFADITFGNNEPMSNDEIYMAKNHLVGMSSY